jgi:urea-proton symporter
LTLALQGLIIVHQKYIKPDATEAQILRVSHYMVVLFALVMGLAGTIFYYIGVSMGWLYVSLYFV